MLFKPKGTLPQTTTLSGQMLVVSAAGELFNHVDDDLPMWAGNGDRSVSVAFQFVKPFRAPPTLTLGVIGIDCDQAHNLRYNVTAQKVTKFGFEAVFVTWGDTRIARACLSWQAIGLAQQARTQNRPIKAYTAE